MENGKTAKKTKNKGFFDNIWNSGPIDKWFLFIVLGLLGIGLTMMFSASYPYAMHYYNNSLYFIKRQLFFAVIGVAAMLFVSRIRPEFILRFILPLTGITLFLLVIVFFLPQYKAGFYRWIDLKFTTFQPSEIAKFTVIIVGAFVYSKYAKHMSSEKPVKNGIGGMVNAKLGGGLVRESWVPTWIFCAFFGLCAILIYKENHLSGCLLTLGIGAVMMFLGGVRPRWFIVIGAIGLIGATLLCIYIMKTRDQEATGLLRGYMQERIVAWLDKGYDPRGVRWQTNQAVYAIGSGGFFGKGLGGSTQKYMYVSEPQNDMIFSIVCEELGFIGATVVILLFVLLVYRGVIIGMQARNRFAALLAMGLVFQVGLQVVLNIAVATDAIPNTGISLPFFSYGGTSIVMLLGEMGIVLSVSRNGRIEKT